MNREDKINEGQIQLNVTEHYRPLETPMLEETYKLVEELINELYQGSFIDEMKKKMDLSNTKTALHTNILCSD